MPMPGATSGSRPAALNTIGMMFASPSPMPAKPTTAASRMRRDQRDAEGASTDQSAGDQDRHRAIARHQAGHR